MSAEYPAVDTLCPHGPDEYERRPIEAVNVTFATSGEGVIYHPGEMQRGRDEWITADVEWLLEVSP